MSWRWRLVLAGAVAGLLVALTAAACAAASVASGAPTWAGPWTLAFRFRTPDRAPAEAMAAVAAALTVIVFVLAGLRAVLLLSTPAVTAVGASKWGTRGHARTAGLLQREGVVVGRWVDGRGKPELLAYDGPEHQLVAGASRSGKGTGHVVPTLLNWRGSALVYDLKGELWAVTAGFRDRFGHSVRFAPTRPGTCRFNPLLEIRREHMVRDAQNLAAILVDPSGAKPSLDVWDQSASQFLTALILHVLLSEPDGKKHLGRVRELLLDFEETVSLMQRTLHEVDTETGEAVVHPEIARCARSLAEHGERFCSSVRGTMEGYLILWADPEVVAATSVSDFCASDLMVGEHPLTLYIEPPPSDADRLRPLIRAMLYQISRCLMQELETDNRGRAKRHKLLLQLDEFPTLGKLPFIADNLRQMAGYGLKAHLIVQSFSDIAEAYGRDNTILDNCHVVVAFASADIQSAERVSKMTGTVLEHRSSFSRRRMAPLDHRSRTESRSEQLRPLLNPGEVRELPSDQQLVFVNGSPPLRTRKVRYFEDPGFTGRLHPPPPGGGQRPPDSFAGVEWCGVAALGVLPRDPEEGDGGPLGGRPASPAWAAEPPAGPRKPPPRLTPPPDAAAPRPDAAGQAPTPPDEDTLISEEDIDAVLGPPRGRFDL